MEAAPDVVMQVGWLGSEPGVTEGRFTSPDSAMVSTSPSTVPNKMPSISKGSLQTNLEPNGNPLGRHASVCHEDQSMFSFQARILPLASLS